MRDAADAAVVLAEAVLVGIAAASWVLVIGAAAADLAAARLRRRVSPPRPKGVAALVRWAVRRSGPARMVAGALAGVAAAAALRLGPGALPAAVGTGAAAGWCWGVAAERLSATGKRRAMMRSLPEVIDLLLVCADAGLNLSGSLRYVAGVTRGPMGEAIARVSALESAGSDLVAALRQVFDAGAPPPIRAFCSILANAHARGMPVSEALKAQAWAMRVRRKSELDALVRTMPTRLGLCAIVFLLPPVIVLAILPPLLMFITSNW